jgi:hypothetical protein
MMIIAAAGLFKRRKAYLAEGAGAGGANDGDDCAGGGSETFCGAWPERRLPAGLKRRGEALGADEAVALAGWYDVDGAVSSDSCAAVSIVAGWSVVRLP